MRRHELVVDGEVDRQAAIVVARTPSPRENCDVARTCQNMFKESTNRAITLIVYDRDGYIEDTKQRVCNASHKRRLGRRSQIELLVHSVEVGTKGSQRLHRTPCRLLHLQNDNKRLLVVRQS